MIRNLVIIGTLLLLSACTNSVHERNRMTGNDVVDGIVFYDWEDDIPQEVLDQFTEETGISVNYLTYQSEREMEFNLYFRNADFDVVIMDNDTISEAIKYNLLSKLDYEYIPNFKFISIDFRDLVYDSGNTYSIPFNWGTTGIIYLKNDEFDAPKAWSDLWQVPESIKIGIKYEMPYDNLAFTKKMIGVSINDCDPKTLENVAIQFMALRENIVWIEADAKASIDELEAGNIDMLVGWSDDVFEAKKQGLDVEYVLPEEGTMLWGDSYVVTARSENKDAAMKFINYLLDPQVSAEILEYNNYASANDSVSDYLPADLINDSIIFPDNETMQFSEIYMPVTNKCNAMQLRIWDEIIEAIE